MVSGFEYLTDQWYYHRLIQELANAVLVALGRGQWMGKLRTCFEVFGWLGAVPLWLGYRGGGGGGGTKGDDDECCM